MKLGIQHNLPDVLRKIDTIGKQARFATIVALNNTAYQVKREIEAEMPRHFDRPTPWTLKSVRYTKATKARLEASVWFDPWGNKRAVTAEQFVGPHIFGGPRKAKGFEVKLRRAGILGDSEYLMPGSGAPIDAFGNVPGGFIVRVLSRLQASDERGFQANETPVSRKKRRRRKARPTEFFVGGIPGTRGAHLPRGIYARTAFAWGSAIKAVFFFVKQPRYKRRFPFQEIGQRVADRVFPREFDQAMARALATAR